MEYSLSNFLAAQEFLVVGLGATYEVGPGEWSLYKSASSEQPGTVIEVSTPAGYLRFDALTGQGLGTSFIISLPDPLTEIHLVIRPGGEARWFLNQDQAQSSASSLIALYAPLSLFLPVNYR